MLLRVLRSSRPTMSATAIISPVRSTRSATVREMRKGRARGRRHALPPRALGARVAEEDEAALGTREQQSLVESVLEQGVRIALPRQSLRRLGERLDVRERPALERLHVFLDALDLAQVGGRSQPLEDHAGAPKDARRLQPVPRSSSSRQATQSTRAAPVLLPPAPATPVPSAARRRPRPRRHGRASTGRGCARGCLARPGCRIGGELERLRCAHGGRFRIAQQQIELGEPPLGFEDLVAGPDAASDVQRLPVGSRAAAGSPLAPRSRRGCRTPLPRCARTQPARRTFVSARVNSSLARGESPARGRGNPGCSGCGAPPRAFWPLFPVSFSQASRAPSQSPAR